MPFNSFDIQTVLTLAQEAGTVTLKYFRKPHEVFSKDDESPLTIADLSANDIIVKGLEQQFPNIPIITEELEMVPYSVRKAWTRFWLVDPLDGTQQFIQGNPNFTVNIALVEDQKPVFGVMVCPYEGTTYWALKNKGCKKITSDSGVKSLKNIQHQENPYRVLDSHSHRSQDFSKWVDNMTDMGKKVAVTRVGSSLKFGKIADGNGDIYPRFGPTMEWDIAAGHIIAEEAGNTVIDLETRQPVRYNKKTLKNNAFVVMPKTLSLHDLGL